ncbi:MAG: class I SAM-dependent methyltransferase [Ruminococcus sp.]|nr:class I SAM-dependent methyltransferase [Ruminococcus sp.]
MDIRNENIDKGNPFDWGRTSSDYAQYRDIYPEIFYKKIADRGLCINGQKVLDIGTGTGVIPRNMYNYGAEWTVTDISANQIRQAERLAAENNMNIKFTVSAAENISFLEKSFDIITACQCFWYFDHEVLIPKLAEILRDKGKLIVLSMEWLPFEDKIAEQSERLVLKYNPDWTGAGETRKPVYIPDIAEKYFEITEREEYDLNVHFTRESWNRRIKSCRGIGASLSEEKISSWEKEHKKLLGSIAPEEFDILHHAALAVLQKK